MGISARKRPQKTARRRIEPSVPACRHTLLFFLNCTKVKTPVGPPWRAAHTPLQVQGCRRGPRARRGRHGHATADGWAAVHSARARQPPFSPLSTARSRPDTQHTRSKGYRRTETGPCARKTVGVSGRGPAKARKEGHAGCGAQEACRGVPLATLQAPACCLPTINPIITHCGVDWWSRTAWVWPQAASKVNAKRQKFSLKTSLMQTVRVALSLNTSRNRLFLMHDKGKPLLTTVS